MYYVVYVLQCKHDQPLDYMYCTLNSEVNGLKQVFSTYNADSCLFIQHDTIIIFHARAIYTTAHCRRNRFRAGTWWCF